MIKKTLNFKDLHFRLNPSAGGYMFGRYDLYHLDCLLDPARHIAALKKLNSHRKPCFTLAEREGKEEVGLCAPCGNKANEWLSKVNASKDSVAALKLIKDADRPVYALVAPAFLGQFSGGVTPGKLRAALKALGFDGMIEVALFADILTLKEALEFDRNIKEESDFQITSCCCPMWVGMMKKIYRELVPHMPPSVSPMIASGRVIKRLYPDAATVFIGPCLAKKAEAREPDLAGAVDIVLTFRETEAIFGALTIEPETFEDVEKEHSSYTGRVYAHAGGVSEAVRRTLQRINPGRSIMPIAECADGVPACRAMIGGLAERRIRANFYEGMGCTGGCVGGPRACTDAETGKKNVIEYAQSAQYITPIDNPYIIELLHLIGIDTDEDLLNSPIFNRAFEL